MLCLFNSVIKYANSSFRCSIKNLLQLFINVEFYFWLHKELHNFYLGLSHHPAYAECITAKFAFTCTIK